jgi:hypothetical protein
LVIDIKQDQLTLTSLQAPTLVPLYFYAALSKHG